jgi:hypothetical protein
MFEVLLIDTYPGGMVAVGARKPKRDVLKSGTVTSEVSSPTADAMIHDAPTNYFRLFAFHEPRRGLCSHDGTESFKGRKMVVVDPRLTAAPDATGSGATGAVGGRSEGGGACDRLGPPLADHNHRGGLCRCQDGH